MTGPISKFTIVQGLRAPLFLILFLMLLRTVVSSDVCEDGTFCPPPNLCCEEKCCLVYETGKEFSPIYRLSLWNAWYFWFIVIFIVISCFGGCGYWRRRHMHFVSTSFHRRRCGSLTPIHEDPQGGDSGNESSRPQRRFIPLSHTFQNPPPYNEVTSKPDMYPLVQGGHDLKHESLAFVYATTPFFHSYLPYNSGAIGLYLSSPAESNSSSLFQSTTASNYMYPPPYSDGIFAHPSVSTPGSMLSACTPTEHSLTTHFLSSVSPPLATTPTSQQVAFSSSEVTTPADSLLASPCGFYRQGETLLQQHQLPVDPFARQVAGHLFANLVADIQQMTSQMMVTSPPGGGGEGGGGESGGGGGGGGGGKGQGVEGGWEGRGGGCGQGEGGWEGRGGDCGLGGGRGQSVEGGWEGRGGFGGLGAGVEGGCGGRRGECAGGGGGGGCGSVGGLGAGVETGWEGRGCESVGGTRRGGHDADLGGEGGQGGFRGLRLGCGGGGGGGESGGYGGVGGCEGGGGPKASLEGGCARGDVYGGLRQGCGGGGGGCGRGREGEGCARGGGGEIGVYGRVGGCGNVEGPETGVEGGGFRGSRQGCEARGRGGEGSEYGRGLGGGESGGYGRVGGLEAGVEGGGGFGGLRLEGAGRGSEGCGCGREGGRGGDGFRGDLRLEGLVGGGCARGGGGGLAPDRGRGGGGGSLTPSSPSSYGVAGTRSKAVQMDAVSSSEGGMTTPSSSSVFSPGGESTSADRWSAEATGGSRSAANALSLPSLSTSSSSSSSSAWRAGQGSTSGVNEGTNTSPLDVPNSTLFNHPSSSNGAGQQ